MKGQFEADNCLDKHGSLRKTKTQVSKLVPRVLEIQDSKTIARNADRDLDFILMGGEIREEEEVSAGFELLAPAGAQTQAAPVP